jgi:hypothetical protein
LITTTAQFCTDDEGLLNEITTLLREKKIDSVQVRSFWSLKDSEIRKQLSAFSPKMSLSTRTSIAKPSTSGIDDRRTLAPAEAAQQRQLQMKKKMDDVGKSSQVWNRVGYLFK